MTRLFNDPAEFTADALAGFADAHADLVRAVPGGVVRAEPIAPSAVAVVVGGGSGHYPAFCGLVGPGLAAGAVVGNVFTSPSTADAVSVARACERGGGVLFITGNYAGDVMNFSLAADQLQRDGIDARYMVVTDDIASAPVGQEDKRRGIAGDLTVFKVASAAAEEGCHIDDVVAAADAANAATRTFGVVFDGCTMPGETDRLFTLPPGLMGVGVGIHGEPGIDEAPIPRADEVAAMLTDAVLTEAPVSGPARATVLLNSLGATTVEELYVLWRSIAPRLRDAGIEIVAPEIGLLCTSLDMVGCSLSLMWLDETLARRWSAPAWTPAFRNSVQVGDRAPGRAVKGSGAAGTTSTSAVPDLAISTPGTVGAAETARPATPREVACGRTVAGALAAARDAIVAAEHDLASLDAIAGDGDHGRGMVRGLQYATKAADEAVAAGAGATAVLDSAGAAWAANAGGTSGVLWGAFLQALAPHLGAHYSGAPSLAQGVAVGIDAMAQLGGAHVGDKTMLDALVPFGERLALDAEAGRDLQTAWRDAAGEAERAARATAELTPKIGRARPLAAKSIGTPDPGATSLAMIAAVIGDYLTAATGLEPDETSKEDA